MQRRMLAAAVLAIALIALAAWAVLSRSPHSPQAAAPAHHLASDAYPLYPDASWGGEEQAQFGDLSGYQVVSAPVQETAGIVSVAQPFEDYYAQKLVAAGWSIDNSLAAGGPGAEVVAYKKDSQELILSYRAIFENTPANAPEQCPCDVTMTIFSGSAAGTNQ